MARERLAAIAALPAACLLLLPAGCAGPPTQEVEPGEPAPKVEHRLTEVATSERRWTGVTISSGGRLFVNYPRWSDDVPISVAEIVDGKPQPYPDAELNSWEPGGDPARQFICVQSLMADDQGALWILDAANPRFEGVVDGGPKLVRFNLTLNRNVGAYRFQFEDPNDDLVNENSYLNDVRIDLVDNVAYLTDSGDGAIIVTDLKTGMSRRLLDDHPSTQAEEITLTIEGEEWLGSGGEPPRVHSDGIALDPDRRYLYYQALTGRTLYRVPTEALRDESLGEEELGARVETVAETGAADGLMFGADGWLYISALEDNAIKRLDPETMTVETVVQEERIKWPDTFTVDGEGRIHFTTAQIHKGDEVTEPFRLFRIDTVPAGTE